MIIRLTPILGAAVLLVGCSDAAPKVAAANAAPAPKAAAAAATAGISDAARKEAGETFAARCTPCHGPAGAGDGPASAGLTPNPRNFQDAAWQKSVSDEHLEKIVQYGGAAVGRSPAMPPNPDLKPEIVSAIRDHIRSLAK